MKLSGARIIIEVLKKEGINHVFGEAGHSVLAFLNAIRASGVRFISLRHEQVAAHAADAYARVTGKPGVVLTHTGPGLMNAVHGVASASMDSIPLIVLSGDVQTYCRGKGPHQELKLHADADQCSVYRPFVKKAWQINDVNMVPNIVCRAINVATSGRPGPVLISMPQDLAAHVVDVELPDPSKWRPTGSRVPGDEKEVERAANLILQAKRPMIFAGGGVLLSKASPELTELAEYLGVPVATTVQGKTAIREDHPLSVGNTGFWGSIIANKVANEADVVLGVGTRFAEIDCSFWDPKFTFRIPPTRLIHVDVDYEEIGRNYPVEVGIPGDAKAVLGQILELVKGREKPREWKESSRHKEIRKMLDEQDAERAKKRESDAKPIEIARLMNELRGLLPKDGIVVCDVGWAKSGASQHLPLYTPGTLIAPGGMAGMGFGPAAAIGAKLGQPNKEVVAVVGDGAFSSTNSSVAAAVEHGIKVIWIILNNYGYGSVKNVQKGYFGEVFGTEFVVEETGDPYNPNFSQMAEAYGAAGERLEDPKEIRPALQRAFKSDKPYVLDTVISRELGVVQAGDWGLGLSEK
jgi:acetolactate synthase-1/2/3 large subunit